MPNQKSKGFSLIELMIVVAIIATLSAIAIPAYRNYVTKSQLTAGITVLRNLITPAELYLQEHAHLVTGTDLTYLGISKDSSKLGTLSIENDGTLSFHYVSPAGAVAHLNRDEVTGWQCQLSLPNDIDPALTPVSCR
ncbi:pilin [Vibrio nitrifigilis]|uniref:Pilin n=1 Tax=Vibrio nitrifigilis TaxID=2789781 RepID=A0ABS0GGN7_9VIBR|nr:pilin [Vibrio nitrifigilis]MBF9001596.1 pilin [Vibrio nitrifigilis]